MSLKRPNNNNNNKNLTAKRPPVVLVSRAKLHAKTALDHFS
jgi:hypothetical protein